MSQERHDNQIPAKHVLAQRPGPGELVKKSRIVELDVSLGPQMVKVPDVIGLSEREAKVEIANAGLLVAEPVKEEHDEKMAEGYVFKQNPNPHEQVPRGSSVELVISLGPELQYISHAQLDCEKSARSAGHPGRKPVKAGEVNNQVSYDYFPAKLSIRILPRGSSAANRGKFEYKPGSWAGASSGQWKSWWKMTGKTPDSDCGY